MNPAIEKILANINRSQVFETLANRLEEAANKSGIWDAIGEFLSQAFNPREVVTNDTKSEDTNNKPVEVAK